MRKSLAALAICLAVASCEQQQAALVDAQNIADNQARYQELLWADRDRADDLVVVLVDGSGSMAGSKLATAKKSLDMFFQKLPADQPAAIYVFDDNRQGWAINPGIHAKDELRSAVKSITAGGGTPLGASMTEIHDTFARLKGATKYDTYTVLVVTDGDASDSGMMRSAAVSIINDGFYLDVVGYELPSNHELKAYASRYREADETTIENVLLEARQ